MSAARDRLLAKIVDWYAANGVGDTSMRTLAAAVGTSNRMLNYHFGSREELLAAVVEEICRAEQQALDDLVEMFDDAYDAAVAYWHRVADTAQAFAPLFFELSTHTMYGKPYAEQLRELVTRGWVDAFTRAFSNVTNPASAEQLARLSVAVGRGVLFDLALTGDRATADAVIHIFTTMVRETTPPA